MLVLMMDRILSQLVRPGMRAVIKASGLGFGLFENRPNKDDIKIHQYGREVIIKQYTYRISRF